MVWITSTFPGGSGEQFIGPETAFWDAADVTLLPVEYGPSGPQRPIPENFSVDFRLADAWSSRSARVLASVRAAAHPLLVRELADLRRRGKLTPARATMAFKAVVQALMTRDAVASLGPVDVVYTYWLKPMTVGAVMAGVAPVVSRAHAADLYEEGRPASYNPLMRTGLSDLDTLFSISEGGMDYLRERYGFRDDQLALARLGVDMPPRDTDPWAPSDTLRLVTISTLVPKKRVDLAARGIAEYARRHPEQQVDWTHLGDGPLRAQVETVIAEVMPSTVQVEFRGMVPHAELLETLSTQPFDLMLNTSDNEGVPVSIMEAAVRGLPCLATDVGATREAIVPGSGFLLPVDLTPAHLADALDRQVDPARDPQVRQAANELVRERFDAQRNYRAFVDDVLGSIA